MCVSDGKCAIEVSSTDESNCAMNDTVNDVLGEIDEEILAHNVSDEALEAAAIATTPARSEYGGC
jgi:hypothetical protein